MSDHDSWLSSMFDTVVAGVAIVGVAWGIESCAPRADASELPFSKSQAQQAVAVPEAERLAFRAWCQSAIITSSFFAEGDAQSELYRHGHRHTLSMSLRDAEEYERRHGVELDEEDLDDMARVFAVNHVVEPTQYGTMINALLWMGRCLRED